MRRHLAAAATMVALLLLMAALAAVCAPASVALAHGDGDGDADDRGAKPARLDAGRAVLLSAPVAHVIGGPRPRGTRARRGRPRHRPRPPAGSRPARVAARGLGCSGGPEVARRVLHGRLRASPEDDLGGACHRLPRAAAASGASPRQPDSSRLPRSRSVARRAGPLSYPEHPEGYHPCTLLQESPAQRCRRWSSCCCSSPASRRCRRRPSRKPAHGRWVDPLPVPPVADPDVQPRVLRAGPTTTRSP